MSAGFATLSPDGSRLLYSAQGALLRVLRVGTDRAAVEAMYPGVQVIEFRTETAQVDNVLAAEAARKAGREAPVVVEPAVVEPEPDLSPSTRRPSGWRNRLHALGYGDAEREAMTAEEVNRVIRENTRKVANV